MVAVSLLVAVAAGLVATRIPVQAGTATIVDRDDPTYRATEAVRRTFGEEPVVILAEGDLPEMILGEDLLRLLRLEGCIAGKVPKGAKPLPGACRQLAARRPVEFVAGPGTFLNEAVIQIERQLTRLARTVPPAQLRNFLLAVASRYGITSLPSLTNADFISTVVFDLARGRGTPKARLSYLFPNSHSAQIVVRLKPDLGEGERRRALALIEEAVRDTTPRRACAVGGKPAPCFELENGRYVLSGAPVVVDALARALVEALLVLFVVGLAVMALTLLLVFRSRLRLLPLGVAIGSAAIAFGLWGLLGGSLTMASIAVLPILIGLAVDYAIQFQARYDEALAALGDGGEAAAGEPSAAIWAARRAARDGGPTIAVACLATGAGFLVLQLSPIPMVRGFGLLLLLGIAVAFVLALSAGFAALSLAARGRARRGARAGAHSAAALPPSPLPAPPSALARFGAAGFGCATRWPQRVLLVGLVAAIGGWVAGTRVQTVSDIRLLAPQSLTAVRELTRLQDATGVAGELDVLVEAPDLADPATLDWMAQFKRRVLREAGFSGNSPSCLRADLCPGPALSDLLVRGRRAPSAERSRATLEALSPYALRQVAPLDPRTGRVGNVALLSFGIRARSLADQQAVVERVRRAIGGTGDRGDPPSGVRVRIAGLPAVAAGAAADLSASRYWLTLAALVAIGAVLLLAYRSLSRALVPLVPTALAAGWAGLVLWLTGIPLNPMSSVLGVLTIAIATEFSVILSGRFHEERRAGQAVREALAHAYRRAGAAVLASGATAIAGFAVLIASDIQMLRDFGLVTVVDLLAALAGVLIVLPAALVWIEDR